MDTASLVSGSVGCSWKHRCTSWRSSCPGCGVLIRLFGCPWRGARARCLVLCQSQPILVKLLKRPVLLMVEMRLLASVCFSADCSRQFLILCRTVSFELVIRLWCRWKISPANPLKFVVLLHFDVTSYRSNLSKMRYLSEQWLFKLPCYWLQQQFLSLRQSFHLLNSVEFTQLSLTSLQSNFWPRHWAQLSMVASHVYLVLDSGAQSCPRGSLVECSDLSQADSAPIQWSHWRSRLYRQYASSQCCLSN